MHIHILGICGTFMGGLALIARAAGHKVTGCDAGVYPPMSTQLEEQGIELIEGYDNDQLTLNPDLFIIGNVVSRGNPLMEEILNRGLPYMSGPQWLGEQVLQHKHVLAVAGTHGKTTTSSMLAWILADNQQAPSFLIGGVAHNFGVSARLNDSPYFVIEADEYDTAFFDKRSKFVHYRTRTAILNNLEFDHADIFNDLAAIETQFHHFVRTVPANGRLVVASQTASLERVLARGCWTDTHFFGENGDWQAKTIAGSTHFRVLFQGQEQGTITWTLTGKHNQSNALAAIAAAEHIGISPKAAITALNRFEGIKRRMEIKGQVRNITVYDDFAHHPTAIQTTLEGLRNSIQSGRIIAVLEPRSNTMKLGAVKAALPSSLDSADKVFCYGEQNGKNAITWDMQEAFAPIQNKTQIHHDLSALIQAICLDARSDDHIVIMSNGSFGGLHDKLLSALAQTAKD